MSSVPFLIWGAMGWATQAPQQHILIKQHQDYGSTAVALNSSINYLGSSIGSALYGSLLLITRNINALIILSILFCSMGVLVQLINTILNVKKTQ